MSLELKRWFGSFHDSFAVSWGSRPAPNLLARSDFSPLFSANLLDRTSSLDSIKPGGAGQASSIRVRLLHAAVRRRIMKLAKERPEYYSIESFGIPINDLDSIGTIVTFSATLIWLGFPRQGTCIS
jgi:hypothetical protein